ncbi:MAG: hypothetical protein KBF88_02245 [Polyangiaceae bacterium]|nr:hypothetical protein [Polyangiaceae bacterium]
MGLGSLAIEASVVVAILLVSGLPLTVAWVTTFRGKRKNGQRERVRPLVLVRVNETADEQWRDRLARDRDSAQFDTMMVVAGEALELASSGATKVTCISAPLEETLASNRKIARLRLAEMELARLGSVTIVVADADVELSKAFLEDARTLEHGMLWSPPLGGHDDSLGQALLSATLQSFMAISALTKVTRSAPAMAGKAFAITSETLTAIGGFSAFGAYIGEDIAMSEALHRLAISVSPSMASRIDPQTWRGWLQRCTRWMQVLRAHRPISYWTYPFLMTPLVWVIPAVFATRGSTWIGLVYYALVRFWMVLSLGRISSAVAKDSAKSTLQRGVGLSFLWGFVGDLLLVIAWLLAVKDRGIRWQGRQYLLGRGGSIESVSVLTSQT